MLDTFISLLEIAGTAGKVTSASLYPSGYVFIEVDNDGDKSTLTYTPDKQENRDENL